MHTNDPIQQPQLRIVSITSIPYPPAVGESGSPIVVPYSPGRAVVTTGGGMPLLVLYQVDDGPLSQCDSVTAVSSTVYHADFTIKVDDCPADGEYVLTVYAWDDQGEPSYMSVLIERDNPDPAKAPLRTTVHDPIERSIQPRSLVRVWANQAINIEFTPAHNADRFGACLWYFHRVRKSIPLLGKAFDKERDRMTFAEWLVTHDPYQYTPPLAGGLVFVFLAWDASQARALTRDKIIHRQVAFRVQ